MNQLNFTPNVKLQKNLQTSLQLPNQPYFISSILYYNTDTNCNYLFSSPELQWRHSPTLPLQPILHQKPQTLLSKLALSSGIKTHI